MKSIHNTLGILKIYILLMKPAKDMENLKASLNSLLEYQDKLTSSSDNLFSCLSLYDKFSEIVEKVYVYSHMKLHQDTSNSLYQALSDKAKALSIDFSSASSFIIPEILKASDETLKSYLNENKDLKLYSHLINDLLRQKEHILSKEEELLLAKTSEIGNIPQTVFSMLNDADISFPSIKDENDEEIEVTKGRYIQLMESSNRNIRKLHLNLFIPAISSKTPLQQSIMAVSKRCLLFLCKNFSSL